MPTGLIVLADPSGGDDAAGRVFNALAAASDFRRRGEDVTIVFQGAGTRWPALLHDGAHPFHALFTSVAPAIAGVSDACSTFFGSRDGAVAAGADPVGGNAIEGVGELASLAQLAEDGYRILTF